MAGALMSEEWRSGPELARRMGENCELQLLRATHFFRAAASFSGAIRNGKWVM